MRARWITLAGMFALAACKAQPPAPPPRPPGPAIYEMAVTATGFEPSRFEARPGEEVTLRITRKVDPTCGDAVIVQGDPVRHMLPLNAPVELKIKAPASGEITFACPMHMYKGAIVVTAAQ